jgi:hypothetical protein
VTDDAPTRVAREWEVWAAENLLRGVAPAEIAQSLVARGVDPTLASALIADLARSPFLEASQPFVRDARRFAMVAKMRERLERDAAHPTSIERRDAPSAEEFFDTYYAGGRPVILRGLVDRWPAFEKWTFAALRDRFGDAEVMVTVGREDDPLYGATFQRRTETWTVRTLIDRIEATKETNDFYLVAQCKALQGALAAMVDDIVMPEDWMPKAKLASESSLWLGPAGTLTRLHHDFKPLLTCHVRGRKRWRLIPPTERALLDRLRMSHTTLDPETDAMEGVLVKDVIVEEGEAIFLPPGWWHHVRALDPCITISLGAWPRDETEMLYLRLGTS